MSIKYQHKKDKIRKLATESIQKDVEALQNSIFPKETAPKSPEIFSKRSVVMTSRKSSSRNHRQNSIKSKDLAIDQANTTNLGALDDFQYLGTMDKKNRNKSANNARQARKAERQTSGKVLKGHSSIDKIAPFDFENQLQLVESLVIEYGDQKAEDLHESDIQNFEKSVEHQELTNMLSNKSTMKDQIKDTYKKIKDYKMREKGLKSDQSYCLLSVQDYIKLTGSTEGVFAHGKQYMPSTLIPHQALKVKRPRSQQARRWYHPEKPISESEKMINFAHWNARNQQIYNQNLQKKSVTFRNRKVNEDRKKFNQTISHFNHRSDKNDDNQRRSRCLTEEAKRTNHIKLCRINKKEITRKLIDLYNYKTKKVKHTPHKEKFGPQDFRKDSKDYRILMKKVNQINDRVFQNPWSEEKFPDYLSIPALTL